MDLVVNSKGARKAGIVLVLALAGIAALLVAPQYLTSAPKNESHIPDDAMAAVEAVTAFYTLDYTEPPNLWQERVCAHTTKNGCQAIREFYAASVQASVDQYRVQTYAMAQPVQMVADFDGRRIWRLELTLTNPWNDETSRTQDIYVEVEMENGEWRLNRVLFEQEAAQFITPTP